MYQFFVEPEQVLEDRIYIRGNDVNHIRNVLRMKGGERVRVSVRTEGEELLPKSFFGTVTGITEAEVELGDIEEDAVGTELANRIYLFQGLPKGDKMELIIQKCVELGVYEIIPVAMKNCVVKLDEKKAQSKRIRWQAISESAAKQSKRTVIPNVQLPVSWKQALELAKEMDVVLIPFENQRGMEATREILSSIQPGQSVAVFIGPEGGFAPEEIEGIEGHKISLGRRILRTETAGLCTMSMLIFALDR